MVVYNTIRQGLDSAMKAVFEEARKRSRLQHVEI